MSKPTKEELLRQINAQGKRHMPATPILDVQTNRDEKVIGNPNPNHSATYIHGTNKQKGVPGKARYADGGFVEQAKELYDVAQNYPEEFEKAYTGFKGEMTKIYDFWKDLLGFRRGGHVAFKR